VPTTSGYTIDVNHGLDRLAGADLLAVPAWPELDAPLDPRIAEALRAGHDRGATVLSICSGAFALAGAGLLDGRRATTHWQFLDRLARRHPRVRLEHDVLYVTDGRIVTSAGAAAGIDACLQVVRREHGAVVANALARRMVVPAHRDGGQAQYVELPVSPSTGAGDGIAEVLDWAVARLDHPLTVAILADRAGMAPRTFARHFRAATGTTPHRWILVQRLRHAEELLERTDLTIDAVASRSGFGTADTLRHHFAQRRGTTPGAHRRAFRTHQRAAVATTAR
jgi:AraC family transcriptional activator FtrA